MRRRTSSDYAQDDAGVTRVRTDFLTLLLSQAIKVNIFSRPSFSQKVLTILFATGYARYVFNFTRVVIIRE